MTEALAMPQTERQRYWLMHIQACEASGKRIAEYAADRQIDAKAKYAGKKALVTKGGVTPHAPESFSASTGGCSGDGQ